MNPSAHRKLVTLALKTQTTNDTDGVYEDLNPPQWWCSLEPVSPGHSDGTRVIQFFARGRFRPDITIDVRMIYLDPLRRSSSNETGQREFFVKGVQNVNEANQELILFVDETAA